MNDIRYVMVIISAPAEAAPELARTLITRRAAACVQITQHVNSFYQWKGVMHEEPEVLLFAKTAAAKLDEVKQTVAAHHPYEIPEVIAVPIIDGISSYFNWIDEAVAGSGPA